MKKKKSVVDYSGYFEKRCSSERKPYSFFEIYMIIVESFRMIKYRRLIKKVGATKDFIERIMLAVTEVNGCAMCSYAHSQWALDAGVSDKEVEAFLSESGVLPEGIPKDEISSILFAQHYAENRAYPEKPSWKGFVKKVGKDKAKVVLFFIRMIMLGNSTGFYLASFLQRVRGLKADPKSSLAKEIFLALFLIIAAPFIILQVILMDILFLPLIRFKKS